MKKLFFIIQVFIAVLIAVKVASFFGVLQKFDISSDSSVLTGSAMAQSKAQKEKALTDVQPVKPSIPGKATLTLTKDTMEDILTKQRDLAEALAARKAELDNRENALRADEQRLIAMRKDITEKIEILKAQEEKLASQLEAAREEDIKRYKDLAKVFEATPPSKAGPMLEKLDTKTAANITMNMKKDKAGALWAYISPQKAVEITKEITRNGGYKE